MATGVVCAEDILQTFEEFKLQQNKFKGCPYIIYKINDEKTTIIIDKIGEVGKTFNDFVSELPEVNGRFAVVDVKLETNDGRSTSKLVLITWVPDSARVREKMLYAGSKETLKSSLDGIGIQINANDMADLDFESVVRPFVLKYCK